MPLPQVWIYQEHVDKYYVSVEGEHFFPSDSFIKACEMVKQVNQYYEEAQKELDENENKRIRLS